ncbi:MAG: RluA family pseudouridine synthase [Planctomycetes bacterium]|nr:RluA family pseudouridine synthase [Planctomycetota bacterium]
MTKDERIVRKKFDFTLKRPPNIDRIDAFLAARFPEYSRTFIQKLIDEGLITVDGEPVKASYTPHRGDTVEAEVPMKVGEVIEPEEMDLDIIYEDEWIIVVNKPWDMVVHPSRGHQTGTLVNAVAYHCENLSEFGGDLRPGIVHRLDRDTTGVILMIKDESIHQDIAKQFEHRETQKEYIAICEGVVELDSDVIDAPIGKHLRDRTRMAIRYDRGKKATTLYEVVQRLGDFTIVRCKPHSGRTHQIRLHMKHVGHPIVSDCAYGYRENIYLSDLTGEEHYPSESPLLSRQALHARRLKIFHPAREEEIEFEAPVPDDMMALVNALREQNRG